MKQIGLLSDTHGHLDERIIEHLSDCDEIWHAGDLGDISVLDRLSKIKTTRAVYGNIDGNIVRQSCPPDLNFICEDLKVYLTHIGGYPGHYAPGIREKLELYKPDLFICGHSHILKVIPDKVTGLLHINPGAAGIHGFHKFRTLVKFRVNGKKIENLKVVELGLRGQMN